MNLLKFKLTNLEKKWILYDVGNSAWILLTASILPILFGGLTSKAGITSEMSLSYYAYSISIATLIAAFMGPILGAISDMKGMRKKIFISVVLIGTIGNIILGLLGNWFTFLMLFIVVRVAFQSSLVINDAMLVDITTEDRIDNVSANGYAWGYIGSVIPFLMSLGVVLGKDLLGIPISTAIIIAFTITSIWWFICALPLFRAYKQKTTENIIKNPFNSLAKTLKEIVQNRKILLFLIAFFFYIDGVYTIIDLATKFGESMGLDTNGLLIALLVTQIVAFPASIFMGRLSQKYKVGTLIKVSILAYFVISIVAIIMSSIVHFFILAILVGLFQGGIQALSRSYFARIIPEGKSGEYFGIYDICGKGASFLGTTAFAIVTQLTNNSSVGISVISVFFIVGLFIFSKADKIKN